jgi:palmitoyl-protein thioesterase
LGVNQFLADINNEYPQSLNTTYRENLVTLNKLVLILFEYDKTVVPKESSWFGSEAPSTDDVLYSAAEHSSRIYSNSEQVVMGHTATMEKTMIPMRLQPLYTEDWIGLRQLDERGDVVLDSCPGEHMQLTNCWEPFVKKYTGGEVKP